MHQFLMSVGYRANYQLKLVHSFTIRPCSILYSDVMPLLS